MRINITQSNCEPSFFLEVTHNALFIQFVQIFWNNWCLNIEDEIRWVTSSSKDTFSIYSFVKWTLVELLLILATWFKCSKRITLRTNKPINTFFIDRVSLLWNFLRLNRLELFVKRGGGLVNFVHSKFCVTSLILNSRYVSRVHFWFTSIIKSCRIYHLYLVGQK